MIHFEPKATQPTENETYKIGDTFLISGSPYLLCLAEVTGAEQYVILSHMTLGKKWDNMVSVIDPQKITPEEFAKIVPPDHVRKAVKTDFKLIQL